MSLSTRMRPGNLNDFTGQEHFLYPGSLFYNSIINKKFDSAIFFGPSGTGKTTLARIIANMMDSEFQEINASDTGTKDLKKLLENARIRFLGLEKKRTFLYVDEFHRWNKLQQDSLLRALEEGSVKFIGSTTENPYFTINRAILSRVGNIYEFHPLSKENIVSILKRAYESPMGLGNIEDCPVCSDEVLEAISTSSSGDARFALDILGFIVENLEPGTEVDLKAVSEAVQQKPAFFSSDLHYDLLSALQKSIRGSDPDAAIHYFSRLVNSGVDLMVVGRRLMVMASEDIGLAYPSAISIVTSCVQAAQMIGFPEASIPLSQAVILLASSPKSNSCYIAYNRASADLHSRDTGEIPAHLRDTHYSGAKKLGHGDGYLYPHAYGGYVKQQYLPDILAKNKTVYYEPTENGSETGFKKFVDNQRKHFRD